MSKPLIDKPWHEIVIGDATLYYGDMLDVVPGLTGIDAVVTDSPYGLNFMGKDWDRGVPGERYWRVILDACKPGAHLVAFGGTRTYHRLVCAIEDAGWEIRDTIMWTYGEGLPKSRDVSKAIDDAAGAEREIVGETRLWGANASGGRGSQNSNQYQASEKGAEKYIPITAPATEAAKQWDGWGTALKPAVELICLARKPLSEKTIDANILKHGVGALNIDACRIGPRDRSDYGLNNAQRSQGNTYGDTEGTPADFDSSKGRWPANLIHDGSEEVIGLFPAETGLSKGTAGGRRKGGTCYGDYIGHEIPPEIGFGDSGSAARFFYCAKASKTDRNEGLDEFDDSVLARSTQAQAEEKRGNTVEEGSGGFNKARIVKNDHATVKPVDLMRYLCRLVTPPGGVILDSFMGSGSTGKGAILEGFRFVGVENVEHSFNIACKRIDYAGRQRYTQLQVQLGLFKMEI